MPARFGEEHGMQVSFEWQTQPSKTISRWLRLLFVNVQNKLVELAEQRADDIEAWMRENAPWQDRTGYAREHLVAEVAAVQDSIINIYAFYQEVPYDVYLEMMQSGKFSILGPAIDYWGPILLQDVKDILGQ